MYIFMYIQRPFVYSYISQKKALLWRWPIIIKRKIKKRRNNNIIIKKIIV